MNHDATVSIRPTWATFRLLIHKSISHPQTVVGLFTLVKKVSKSFVKLVVGIVTDLKKAIFDSECVAKIFTQIITSNFGGPAVQVFAIEQRFPFLRLGRLKGHQENKKACLQDPETAEVQVGKFLANEIHQRGAFLA